MISRVVQLPKGKSFFLFGPRQTGKSTLIQERWKKDTWEINLLHTDIFLKYSKSPELFRKEAVYKIKKDGIKTIFIDEIQKVPILLDEVHALIQSFPLCQFILTGSSSRKLKRGAANLLAGRVLQRHLFPFIYKEQQDEFKLEEVLHFGSLPALYAKSKEEKIDILKTYTETYLKEEIRAEGLVRNLGGFSRFLDFAASQCGDLVNFSSTGRDAQLPTRTIQSYYEILEDTLIGISLEGWRKSARRRLTTHPKFYLFDLGITNAINRRLGDEPDPVTKGRLFEQWIILETYRWFKYQNSEIRLFYWRTNTGAEVDFLIELAGQILAACEVKLGKHISGANLTGLRSFHEEYPETTRYVISNVDSPYELEGVTILPWSDYLNLLYSDSIKG